MSELERLIVRWSAMNEVFKEPCRKAWKIADPKPPYDEQSEIAYLKELIEFAKLYIDDEQEGEA